MAFDLLLVAAANSPRTPRIAEQIALTAERFSGAVLHDWAAIDPAAHGHSSEQVPRALMRLAQGLLGDMPTPVALSDRPAMQGAR